MGRLVVIHIGKCGGATVRAELKDRNISHSHKHGEIVKYEPNKKYVIVIRNPIQRFISSFNWRHYLIKNKLRKFGVRGPDDIKKEENFYNKYDDNIEKFCNDLKENPFILKDFDVLSHINMDINFYLQKFIDKCPKNQILGVVCTETIKKDMKNIFNIDIKRHNNNNSKYSKNISDESYEILKNYLKNDYLIIHKMYEYGWINDEQYKFLNL